MKMFWKYWFRYFTAFLIILLCSLIVAVVANGSIQTYVEKQNQLKLEGGVDSIRQNISKIGIVSGIFQQDSYFNMLCSVNGELPPEKYMNLKYANDRFRQIGVMQSFFPFAFGLFRHNDMLLSTKWCSDSFSGDYGGFMQAADGAPISAEDFKTQLFEKSKAGPAFWRLDSFTYSADGQTRRIANAILCIVTDTTAFDYDSPYVLAFVIHPEDLEKAILTSGNLKKGAVKIVDGADGSVLMDTIPAKSGRYHFSDYQIADLNWHITVGYPDSLITRQCRNIRMLMAAYIILGLVLMTLLTVYFSVRECRNIKELFGRFPNAMPVPSGGKNDYDILKKLISGILRDRAEYESQIRTLADQNQAIVLERLIVRGCHTQEEREEIRRLFPGPLDFFCVALVCTDSSDCEGNRLAVLCIREYFRQYYPHHFVNVPAGIQNELFLFSLDAQDAPTAQAIRRLFLAIIPALTDDMGLTFSVGISAVGTGAANLSTCCHQARQVVQAYRLENRNVIETYQVDMNAVHENIVDMEFTNRLYSLLLCADREAIHRQFARLADYYRKMPFQYETQKPQIFFSIRNILHNACLHLALDDGAQNLPEYHSDLTLPRMADELETAADAVCARIEAGRKSRNLRLRQQLLDYIAENFANPALNASVICKAVGISEKYLCQFIKEQTGETFSNYLERIRIQKAMDYLQTTDMSNEKIAASTGFAAVNTFYRVFGKRTGVSPKAYRNSRTVSGT